MNKTIIININGTVFHIEEDAYEVLKGYMSDVKRHFMNSADSLEITTDIENRIAEMFNEMLAHENRQVIIEQDVNNIIGQMGTVADFERSEQDTEESFTDTYYNKGATRRLFRDPDDHLIGGVCAGIAKYFDVQPVWIRLAFALIVFAAGSGLILYIILWAVIPKAATRADRMAMRGEKQNLEGFKRNFEQEMGSMRQNFSNMRDEARPFVYKARDFSGDFVHHLGNFLGGAAKFLLKLFGVLVLIACFGWLVFFIVALVTLLSAGYFWPFHELPYEVLRHHHAQIVFISAFVVIAIPIISIILLVLKGIFNTGTLSRTSGGTALILWLCAVGIFVFHVVGMASEYKAHASVSQTIALKPSQNNTYYLTMNESKSLTADDSSRMHIKDLGPNMRVDVDDDNDFESFSHRNIRLDIETSDSGQPVLIESFRARGPFYEAAFANARDIKYMYVQKDSVISFDSRFYGKTDEPWHAEEVDLTLKLPKNSKVIVDGTVNNIANVGIHDCNEINKRDADRLNKATFIMNDDGLQCKVDTLVTDTIIRKHKPGDSTQLKVK